MRVARRQIPKLTSMGKSARNPEGITDGRDHSSFISTVSRPKPTLPAGALEFRRSHLRRSIEDGAAVKEELTHVHTTIYQHPHISTSLPYV